MEESIEMIDIVGNDNQDEQQQSTTQTLCCCPSVQISTGNRPEDELKNLFEELDRLDGTRDGQIPCETLVKWILSLDLERRIAFDPHLRLKPKHIKQLIAKADTNGDGFVDREEFIKLASSKSRYLDDQQQNVLKQYLQVMAYAEEYRFWPPPWFILSITLIQIILFILNHHFYKVFDAKVAQCSYLIFRPDDRSEVWRFLSYMFVHVTVEHLILNITIQLLVGLPLEMSHSSWRVAIVYLCGVFAGSLASSTFDPEVLLAGGSGGVYSLILAHLATLVLNWNDDTVILRHRIFGNIPVAKAHGSVIRWLKLFIVLLYVIIDFVMAIWRREQQKVSYVAHLAGAAAGLAVGIIVLKNRKVETWEIRLKNACLVACVLIYVVFIFWNICKDYLEEKHVLSSMPTENALQDKNINHGESYCNWPL